MIYPMKLKPVLKSYIWGGEKLAKKYGKDGGSVAESWEVAANASGSSVISGGEYDGMTLVDFLSAHPEALGTEATKFEFFPVLVKLIDAASNLSVQVHPDDAYALANEGQYGKTEMWYVVECEPGAGMYCGFKRKVSKEELEIALNNGTITDLLNFIEVKKGDCLFIKSGTVHAICGGVLVYEIQQNSTLTYRLYDYGRVGADGKPRELHIAKALEVTDTAAVCHPGDGVKRLADGVEQLGDCQYFTAIVYDTTLCRSTEVTERSFSAFTCVDGECTITANGIACLLRRGDTCFVPSASGTVIFSGKATLIEAKV